MSGSDSKSPLRIGLTGGIASGKTTVANMFAELGVPIIDTDIIAREVVRPGQHALEDIRERFGDAIIDAAGNLDRSAMRRLIFSDDDARHDLESILHPRIGAETLRQLDAAQGPYQLIVVPLLVESPLRQFMDRIVVVDCDEQTQIERLIARDTESVEQARKILSSQASREERLVIADDVVSNELGLRELRERVMELDEMYRQLVSHPYPRERSPETP